MTVLNFFRGITLKNLLYTGAAIAVGYAVWTGANIVQDKYEAEAEVARLELVVSDYQKSIQILKQAAAQKDRALEAANAARAELETQRDTYEEIRRDAASAPEEADAPIAPVLRNALDALDGL